MLGRAAVARSAASQFAGAECPELALTARSLYCRDSVRLQSYFHRPDEYVSMPALDPHLPKSA